MALAITMSATSSEAGEANSLRGRSRILAQNGRVTLTCDKNPNVCFVKGNAGPDCCNKKCVNFSIDRLNCGRCGKKCSFGKICCEGKCVNPKTNEKHCGKCGNKCNNRATSSISSAAFTPFDMAALWAGAILTLVKGVR
ncbi:hypothetical protein Fmac_009253 [Flemingia macrophylla]|uniref:Stigma-specific STIG1-like protein 1 n=1 Tax=Flemingia macrophylla TaxID=520843 RepID=A0ABD1N0X5_9FABA